MRNGVTERVTRTWPASIAVPCCLLPSAGIVDTDAAQTLQAEP